MALPHQLTNVGNPVVDATQLMDNFNWVNQDVYNVKYYGAKGDGTTDDYAAIQAAINAAASGGTIYLPVGTYNVSQAPTVTLNGHQFNIVGAGMDTKIVSTATTQTVSTGCLRVIGQALGAVGADFIGIENLQLVGSGTCGMGLRLENCTQGTLKNIRAKNFTSGSGWGIGIYLTASMDITIINPIITGCSQSGIDFESTSNANTIIGGWLYNNQASCAGARIGGSNGNVFVGTVLEQNGYGAICSSSRLTRFEGCWFENNSSTGIYSNEYSTIIRDSWFTANALDIDVQPSAQDFQAVNNRFDDGGKITLRSGTGRVTLRDNFNITALTNSGAAQLRTFGNTSYNPVGHIASPPVPATTVAYTHIGPADASVYISGGTVTAIAIGGTSTGATSGVFRVPVGQTITLTYSVAPTWTWFCD